MGRRRDGREAAAQFLYSLEVRGDGTTGNEETDRSHQDAFWALRLAKPGVKKFADELIAGAVQKRDHIDAALEAAAQNFRLERFAATDRNILRVAAYEILFCEDVPPPVVINEAIEIAKRFGTSDSSRFINGVLDHVLRHRDTVYTTTETPESAETPAPTDAPLF